MKGSFAAVAAPILALSGLVSSKSPRQSTAALEYMGCFSVEGTPPTLSLHLNDDPFQTQGLCVGACSRKGYKYFGLKGGNECWCGNSIAEERAVDKSNCDVPCSGYPFDNCGGASQLSIFETEIYNDGDDTSVNLPTTSASGFKARDRVRAARQDIPTPSSPNPDDPPTLTPTSPNPDIPTPTSANPDIPTPTSPNPDLPTPTSPNPGTPTAPNPDAPNPTIPNPPTPTPPDNAANGLSPTKLGTMFTAQAMLLLYWAVHL